MTVFNFFLKFFLKLKITKRFFFKVVAFLLCIFGNRELGNDRLFRDFPWLAFGLLELIEETEDRD